MGVTGVMICVDETDDIIVGVIVVLTLTSVGVIATIVPLVGVCGMSVDVSVPDTGVCESIATSVDVDEIEGCKVGVDVFGDTSVDVSEIGNISSVVSMIKVGVDVAVFVPDMLMVAVAEIGCRVDVKVIVG